MRSVNSSGHCMKGRISNHFQCNQKRPKFIIRLSLIYYLLCEIVCYDISSLPYITCYLLLSFILFCLQSLMFSYNMYGPNFINHATSKRIALHLIRRGCIHWYLPHLGFPASISLN